MNFLDGVISKEHEDVYINIENRKLLIPPSKAKVLTDKQYIGKTVTLGIRPENIHDSQIFLETTPQNAVESTVKVSELLGAEVYLYFDVEGTQVTARINPRTDLRAGDSVRVIFDMEKAHFFDKDTELAITL